MITHDHAWHWWDLHILVPLNDLIHALRYLFFRAILFLRCIGGGLALSPLDFFGIHLLWLAPSLGEESIHLFLLIHFVNVNCSVSKLKLLFFLLD